MPSTLEELRLAGLPPKEAEVYLKLTQLGKANGNLLAKKSGLDRSFTYTLLNNLIEKGLVAFVIEKTKRIYHPTNPDNLLTSIKEKEMVINKLIPKLKDIIPKEEFLSQVKVHEGKEGLKVLLFELYSQKEEMLFFGGTGKSYDVLRWEMPHYVNLFTKSKKFMRGIISEKYKNHEMKNVKGVELRTIKNLNAEATTTIAGDIVGIHVIRENEKPLIIIINNPIIAQTYKSFFEVMWTIGKEQLN